MWSGAHFTEGAGGVAAPRSFLVFVEIREFGAVPFQFSFCFCFSYVVKPGGPEWGKRRLWAAQGVFRAVQSGAKDLDLSAAS